MRWPLHALALLAACEGAPETPAAPDAAAGPSAPKSISATALKAATMAIKAETKVIDFRYRLDDAVQWIVAVESDGAARVGFAECICLLLERSGVPRPGQAVRITDILAQRRHGEDFRSASLGAIRCGDACRLDEAPALDRRS